MLDFLQPISRQICLRLETRVVKLGQASLRAGSHLRAHARATKSEFKSEAILQGLRESEPALISVIFSLPPPNRRNEIIQLNFTANVKFDSKVDSSLTAQCQISRENSRFFNLYNNIPA